MPAEQDDQLLAAIDGYLALHREGRAPSVENWARLHGAQADELRELLPSLIDLEVAIETGTDVRRLPQRFGDCVVVRELGRGGMGVVYEGVQEALKRPVAIKVLINAGGDGTSRERFLREARLAASLQHPNIVPIHAVGTHEGLPYLVMHLVDGRPLIHLIGGAARGINARERQRRAVDMILPAARALAYAHGKGIWHRDIKPANLMRGSDGSVWLTDFGLALAAGSDRLTGTGMLSGTLAYLAPERFNGTEDARSDLYALGLTLLELASARFAFSERTPNELIKRILLSGPPRPQEHDRELEPVLARIIAKAIAAAPADRFATVEAFADALQAWRGGLTPDLGPVARKPRPAWLLPAAAGAGIILLALLLRPGSPPASHAPVAAPAPAAAPAVTVEPTGGDLIEVSAPSPLGRPRPEAVSQPGPEATTAAPAPVAIAPFTVPPVAATPTATAPTAPAVDSTPAVTATKPAPRDEPLTGPAPPARTGPLLIDSAPPTISGVAPTAASQPLRPGDPGFVPPPGGPPPPPGGPGGQRRPPPR